MSKRITSKAVVTANNKAQARPQDANIKSAIKMPVQLFRITTDLNKFRSAVIAAENIWNPNRYTLYQLYQQSMLDSHVTACIQQLVNLITSCEFCVRNKAGEEDEEKSKLIKKKWFREYIEFCIESKFWGHSLIQFGDIKQMFGIDVFSDVDLVPRQYVKPEFHMVMNTTASLPPDGQDYRELPFSNWCLSVGKSRDLGLLLKITPLVIWKKNAMGAWAEFIEKFGSPVRIGKTDSTDLKSVENMQNMLQNMGVAAWGLFNTDDLIEFVESNHSDSFMVFDKMIERCNSEISKLIVGQTMTTDNGSSRSQAEVHERVLEQAGENLKQFIYSVNNDQLVPLMNNLGFGLDGCTIDIEADDELDLKEKGAFDIELLKTGKFTFTPEYLNEKYGTEVIAVEQADQAKIQDLKNVLSKYYS